ADGPAIILSGVSSAPGLAQVPAVRVAARRSPAARRRYLTVALGSVAVASLVAGAVVGSVGNDSALRLARRFVAAWAGGDYAEMYSTVDPNTQRQLSPASFAAA